MVQNILAVTCLLFSVLKILGKKFQLKWTVIKLFWAEKCALALDQVDHFNILKCLIYFLKWHQVVLLPFMGVHMCSMRLKIWLFSFHYSWNIGLIQFYAHAEYHGHGAKYAPFRKNKAQKDISFLCSSQNYADVEIKNPETTCQKLPGKIYLRCFPFPTHK